MGACIMVALLCTPVLDVLLVTRVRLSAYVHVYVYGYIVVLAFEWYAYVCAYMYIDAVIYIYTHNI